jgi:hypothetical protein
MTTNILPNMIPMRDINDISEGDRLFYELGYKKDANKPNSEGNWIHTGKFKEIEDVKSFLEGDKNLNLLAYLNHHNFMVIKKESCNESYKSKNNI